MSSTPPTCSQIATSSVAGFAHFNFVSARHQASIRSLSVLRPSEFHTSGPWPRSGLTSGPVSSGRDQQVVLVTCVP